ncbi:hypothetical protein [Corynebacterium oculi]|uniref:Uncharacterized protein n=1 Tax=Corynebacterium oculi TaxID=1544416 RepID=A0A0N8W003_9CORY|nr:hypothetical protein [Corynebacterium oculi]KQB85338.1 hypothetical protein Cocul_00477 [Corynebacterium oculi]
MTKTLIKLHTTLWGRTMKSNPSVIIMALFVGFYALIGMASAGALLFLYIQEEETAIIPAAIAAGMIAYIVLMAMMPSGEQQVTARDLATLPVTPQQARTGLWWLAFLHSRAVVALLCSVATALVVCLAAGSAVAVVVAVPFLAISFLTTVLSGEVLGRLLGRGAVGKDRLAAWSMVGFIALVLAFNMVVNGNESVPLETLGNVVAWTPLGAAGGAVGASISGQWAVAVAQGLIAVASLGALLWLWYRGVAQDLREPQIHSVAVKEKKKSRRGKEGLATVFLPGLKHNQATAIFSRALRYMRRDSRMVGSLLVLPLVMVFFLYRGYADGAFSAYMGAFILCFFLASTSANDFGYDGPGGWLHMVSGVRARTLLLARHAGSVAVPGAFLVLYCAVVLVLLPDRGNSALVLAAVLGYALSAAGSGLLLSVYNPFPTSRPGTNPWSDRSGYSSAAMISGFAFLLMGWIPLIPGVVALVLGATQDIAWVAGLGVVLAVGTPLVLYLVVIRRCARRIDEKWPEIYTRVRSWVN